MKLLTLFCLLFLSQTSYASFSPCQAQALDLEKICKQQVASSEQFLAHCLRRRDTCSTQRASESQSECQVVHQCMEDHQRTFKQDFTDIHPCRYYWNTKSERCFVRRSFFSIVSQCPGRITLTGTINNGFTGGLDNGFDCSSHAHVLNDALMSCEASKNHYLQNCSADASEVLSLYPNHTSPYLENHQQNSWGITPESMVNTAQDARYFFYPENTRSTLPQQSQTTGQER